MSADEEMSADSNLSNDSDSFGGSSVKGVVLKKGPWTASEDAVLVDYVKRHGEGNWNSVQKHSGLSRCGKSCRLRWANHLRPNLKKGAFTVDEERLIIELHAKMGNKWARMAAHLPGRTDNEIKNYWNTRIKRRNRAGLPLYPSELCLQSQPENQLRLNSSGIYIGDKGYNNIFETSSYEKPGIIFSSPNTLPYPQVFPNITTNDSLVKSFASPQFYAFASQAVQLHKHTQEIDERVSYYKPQTDFHKNKVFQSVNHGCSYDHSKILSPNVNQDTRFMSNSLFSVSKPFEGAEKFEPPSIQYQRTGLGVWNPAPDPLDSLLQSPLSGPPSSRCDSPRSSGVLEALLYDSKDLKKSDNTFLDNSVGSVSDGFLHNTTNIESSFEEKMPVCRNVKSEVIDGNWMVDEERQEVSEQFDFSRPDAILGSCWLDQSASCSKPRGSTDTGPVEALPFEDLGSDSSLSARTSASDSIWGFNSCSWNNMPPVCQMSEFP